MLRKRWYDSAWFSTIPKKKCGLIRLNCKLRSDTYKLLIRGLWWHISCGIVRIWDRSNRIDSNFSVPFKFGNWDTVLASEMSSFCRLGKLMKASGWIVLIGFIFNSINFKSGQFWRRPSGTSSTWFSPISRYCSFFK